MSADRWEKRARELLTDEWDERQALQLGREMAEEARREAEGPHWREAVRIAETKAADARAEEIARLLEECCVGTWKYDHRSQAAAIARSTIAKPEAPKMGGFEAAIRADEREMIASKLDKYAETSGGDFRLAYRAAADMVRRPAKREAVLEEALRAIVDYTAVDPRERARRALEWK